MFPGNYREIERNRGHRGKRASWEILLRYIRRRRVKAFKLKGGGNNLYLGKRAISRPFKLPRKLLERGGVQEV